MRPAMAVGLLAAGCASTPPSRTARPAPAPPPDAPARIAIGGAGSAEKVLPGPPRRKVWTIRWRRAELIVSGESDVAGTLRGVTGAIYQNGVEAATFSADVGYAAPRTSDLRLTGGVTLRARSGDATITCAALRWIPERKLIRASGDVRAKANMGSLGTFPVLLATPDLKKIGTPDLFDPR